MNAMNGCFSVNTKDDCGSMDCKIKMKANYMTNKIQRKYVV